MFGSESSSRANLTPERFFYDAHYSVSGSRKRIDDDVERVTGSMNEVQSDLVEVLGKGRKVLKLLRNNPRQYSEEEERKLVSNFLDLEDGLCDLIDMFDQMENDAVRDPGLYSKNERRVIDSFNKAIATLKELFEVTQSIRWVVMESVEGVDEVVSSHDAEGFIASLQ